MKVSKTMDKSITLSSPVINAAGPTVRLFVVKVGEVLAFRTLSGGKFVLLLQILGLVSV